MRIGWQFSHIRMSAEPLDASHVFESLADFQAYLDGTATGSDFLGTPYAGQIVVVRNGTNQPNVYLIYEDKTYGPFASGGGPLVWPP